MKNDYLYDNYRLVEFYDDMYNYDDDFELWKEYIKSGMQVLEMACGSGRLTRIIVENIAGVTVDALDYSKEMLELLDRKKSFFAMKQESKINLIEADMREYKTEKRYDVIIIPSNSLNHIEENEDMENLLNNLYSMLKPNGYLLFDILNPIFSFLVHDENEWHDGNVYYKESCKKYFYSDEKSKYDYSTQINSVKYRYFYCNKQGDKDAESPEYNMDIKVRLYFPKEMDYYVTKSDFTSVKKYDWYDRRPYIGKTSEQIYVLQK
ncbi:class I SAM-dependent methyltransferase [Butyrivibrio sp. NC3005]|uniref:class I SAM-dependent methyltransferase n=1 Tax=Butyrivibrio sp. NC3005 TaxID=1280685 RepID=UPI000405CE4A|nr:class I SAM-dependent methyltransferase [Butyrivibrio sp. NC3005]